MPEKNISEVVKEYILTEAVQTEKLVYSPPLYVANHFADIGICVSKLYVVRMYARLGIVFENGLWTRKCQTAKRT